MMNMIMADRNEYSAVGMKSQLVREDSNFVACAQERDLRGL